MSVAKANKRKYKETTSNMALLASRKMENISRKGMLSMKILEQKSH